MFKPPHIRISIYLVIISNIQYILFLNAIKTILNMSTKQVFTFCCANVAW